MQVKDIASDGLIYALDPRLQKELGMSDMQQSLALKNILKAQDFDAIPLVDKFKGKITGLARQRLHDGDIHDVFILDVDEVIRMEKSNSILDAIFSIIHNEHHIILLDDEVGDERPTAILTLELLDNQIVQNYLTLKIAELSNENWHWNNLALKREFTNSADYGIKIFKEIKSLTHLMRGDELHSDKDFTTQINNILNLLQPLKNAKKTEIDNAHYVKPIQEKNLDADGLKKWPAVSIFDDENWRFAYTLLAKANDFDEILRVNNKSGGDIEYQVFRKKANALKWSDIEVIEATTINGKMKLNQIIKNLKNDSERPLIVLPNNNEKWPGIVTIHDLASDHMVLSNTLQKAVQIEKLTTIILANQGILNVPTQKGLQPIILGTLNDLLSAIRKIPVIGEKISKEEEAAVRDFRNLIAHNLISLTELTPLPFYHHLLFLDGFLLTNKIHSTLSDYKGPEYPENLALLERIFQFSKSRGKGSSNPMIANLLKNNGIQLNNGEIIFNLSLQGGITMKKYIHIRSIIPMKYSDNPKWYDDCGKYLDWAPKKIQFIFKDLPIDEEE